MATGKKNTKERLLEAAVHEFAENGFEKATLRDICDSAQVNLNAVKYHFGDKMGLYIAAVSHAHVSVTRASPPQTQASDEPLDQLRSFVSEMLAMALSDERLSTPHELLMLREMANPTEATERIASSKQSNGLLFPTSPASPVSFPTFDFISPNICCNR